VLDTIEEEKEIIKTIDGKEVKQKKTWKYFKLGEYTWINYIEMKVCYVSLLFWEIFINSCVIQAKTTELAKGLIELGIEKGEIFNVYAATRSVIYINLFQSSLTISIFISYF
jgi:long-chain acyl-CoA synthetase